MKIKTITCHEVYNHGASLQEYALLWFLNNLGHQAEGIHYKPSYLSNHFSLKKISNPKFDKPGWKQLYLLAKLPARLRDLKRKRAFDAFSKQYIPTDTMLYRDNEALKRNPPAADVFICGSDQIWNSVFQNGKDPAFYLDFVSPGKIKFSFAASFAIEKLEDRIKPFVKEHVRCLNAVSVRETSGVQILNELGVTNVVQVLDPVFLLDKQHWVDTFIFPISEKFVFVYDFDSNPLVEKIAKCLKKEKGYKIYTVNKNITYADKNFYLERPERFLSLVYHAQFNITNSFHALAFSVIFEKQFVVVNRREKINTRMRDLTNLLQTQNLISSFEEFSRFKPIDYEKVNLILEERKRFSKDFLINNLSG